MTTGLSDFFRQNLWANLRLLDMCAQLSDAQLDATVKGTFGSIRATLVHIFNSEEGYAKALTDDNSFPQFAKLTDLPGFDELRNRAKISGEALITIADRDDHDRILHLDNGTYDAPAIIVLIQAVNHGIDHRSQIATLLSQQNITPPDLDSWAYNDATR